MPAAGLAKPLPPPAVAAELPAGISSASLSAISCEQIERAIGCGIVVFVSCFTVLIITLVTAHVGHVDSLWCGGWDIMNTIVLQHCQKDKCHQFPRPLAQPGFLPVQKLQSRQKGESLVKRTTRLHDALLSCFRRSWDTEKHLVLLGGEIAVIFATAVEEEGMEGELPSVSLADFVMFLPPFQRTLRPSSESSNFVLKSSRAFLANSGVTLRV
ncbi:hypothetical protein KCV00_g161, partial [Aureobasidium melanogenum]